MKRPITNLVIGCLAFLAFQLNAQTTTFTVSPTTVTAAASTQFTVDITVEDFDEIVSIQYSNNWNPAILDFVEISNITTELPQFSTANFGTTGTSDGELSLSWLDNSVMGVTLPANTVLYSLTFEVLNTTGTDIIFSGDPTSIEIINVNSQEVTMNPVNCAVNGGGGGNPPPPPPPPPSGDLTIIGSDETAAASSNVCLEVTANDFTDIVSMQFSMHWDEGILTYTGVQGFNLPDLTAGSFGATNSANGDLTISWLDNTAQGVTVANGSTLFEVCFDVIGSSGQVSDFTFDGNPTTIEVINSNSMEVTPTFDAGSVTVSGGTPPPPPPSSDLTIIGSDETAASGTNVCLDVTADNFTDIVSMQFSMHWNENIATFTGVQGFGLPDLTAASFGTTGSANGDLTLSWLDNTAQGVTLANGSTLFQVCFDVIGSSGQSTAFSFDGNPTVVEIINSASQEVTPTFDSGSITVDGGTPPPPSSDLTIIGSDETGASGSNVCLDVTANNFDDIASMQFSMHWDETIATYTGVQGFGLPDLSAASFGATNANNGDLTVSWFDNTAAGVTLSNGSVLFQVCFDLIGSSGDVSTFTFDGNPTTVEFVNASSMEVDPVFDAGSLTIDGGTPPPPPPVNGFAIIASDETVASGDAFCVEVSVNDFDIIASMQYTMEWDQTLFTYTSVQNFGLPDLSAASFGTTGTNNGILTLSWFDNTAQGVTLADGTVIYEVCFDAVGPNNCGNTTQFEFTGNQTIIEVINGNSQEVTFQGVAGDLVICDQAPTNPLTFTAVSQTASNGANVCVPVTISDAGCIASVQFSMDFDETVLDFTGLQNFGFPDMSANGNFNTANANNGVITFSWFDQTAAGINPADGTVVFEICFDVIGDEGDVAPVTFTGTPTIVEAINCSSQEVNVEFNNGSVTVESSTCDPLAITGDIVNNVLCNGDNTGSIDISVGGGNNSYTYVWENSAGQQIATTQDISGRTAGEYCVTVTSCGGSETVNECYTIGQPSTALSVVGSVTNPACFGDNTGSIDISATGGTTFGAGCSGYTYAWSDGPAIADRFSIGAGAYTVTVTDCNGCQIIQNFSVVGSPSALNASGTTTPVTCFNGTDGTVTASASGGVGPYEYRLTGNGVNIGYQTSNIFQNLEAGSYFISVRDEFNCVETTPVTVGTPNPLTTSAIVTNDTDDCNGGINLSVNGGTPGYTYSWEGPGGFTATTQDISDLCPGDYCVTIEDANGCTREGCEVVVAPLTADPINPALVEPACFNTCDGEITLNFEGGTAPYIYAWSGPTDPGQGGPTFDELCAGTYSVTITSDDNQTIVISATVGEASAPVTLSAPIVQNVTVTPLSCNGAVSINASGGFGGYTYNWTPAPGTGQGTGSVTNVCVGDYSVVATDSEGCSAVVAPITVDFDSVALVVGTFATTVCEGQSNGLITIQVMGGIPPYDIEVAGTGFNFETTSSNNTIVVGNSNNIPPGVYTVTVSDSAPGTFQQTTVSTVTVDETILSLSDTTIFPVTNGVNGKIEITVVGGEIPYDYQWSNGSTAQDPANLPPGCYDLTVSDDNGCDAVFEICVENFTASFVNAEPDCPNQNGSITVVPNGSPNEPFTYQWEDENGNPVGTNDATLANVPVGTYTVTIIDSEGVTIDEVETLVSESNLTAALQVTTDFNGFAIRCHGAASGSAEITPADGMPPYSYLWSNASTQPVANGLPAGPVSVTVTDQVGCEFVSSAMLNQPQPLSVETESGRGSCGENTGTATAIVEGGVFPYDYNWDDELMQTAQTAILLEGGLYGVTVVDGNGCDDSGLADVPLFTPLVVVPTSEPDEGGPDGKAIAVVTSGTPPYEFQWNESLVTDSVLTELLPGRYFVKVTDAAGCEELVTVQVDDATVCLDALTVITPEGDGFNEEFKIGCLSRYSDNELQIFNRWGQLVYEIQNYSDGNLWRGTTQRGNEVPDGVYFYVFDYLDPVTNTRESKKGSVTVLRK